MTTQECHNLPLTLVTCRNKVHFSQRTENLHSDSYRGRATISDAYLWVEQDCTSEKFHTFTVVFTVPYVHYSHYPSKSCMYAIIVYSNWGNTEIRKGCLAASLRSFFWNHCFGMLGLFFPLGSWITWKTLHLFKCTKTTLILPAN